MTNTQTAVYYEAPFRGLDHMRALLGHLGGDDPPHLVIAIDGPSASGKGTLARRLGARLGYAVLDTGVLYRAVAKLVLDRHQDPNDPDAAYKAAQDFVALYSPPLLSDSSLRCDELGVAASKVAAYGPVRETLVVLQRNFAQDPPPLEGGKEAKGVILDGRDIGTVICPDADVKLYITADPAERAKRRAKELQSYGVSTQEGAVFSAMRERDARDAGRMLAPLRPAPDAFVIDTTRLAVGEILERALAIVRGSLIHRACCA